MSPEGTSETDYLWRPSTGTPFPRPKSTRVGEVGWGLPFMADNRITQSGRQIVVRLGEFRQYPGPKDEIDPDSDAALVMNVYKPKTPGTRSGSKRSNYSNRKYGRVPSATATTNYYPKYHRQTNYDFFSYTPAILGLVVVR
ncbi:hypothetical protein KUTeg_003438 [Tegillarca granosa]|uniref:Uncharacterized protein n=1 Tax=Tegillarca granosa TaxID=220873 RepID=A0ABQ9FNZ1_TEGGR|nr:hypothetical protein KUTeg_003438 [Tegillarca granosa]